MNESEKLFFFTRAALGTGGRAESKAQDLDSGPFGKCLDFVGKHVEQAASCLAASTRVMEKN